LSQDPSCGKPSRGQKPKHVVLRIMQKLDIIKHLEKGENKNRMMQEFSVGLSAICDIKTGKAIELCHTLRKPKLEQLDKILYKWFVLKCSEGAPLLLCVCVRTHTHTVYCFVNLYIYI
uniref:HTH psq-type domain-containing protein n=1 Tax=Crocodylus porosus TaxID=8502 RepID=A0A7M4DWU8_CROPO